MWDFIKFIENQYLLDAFIKIFYNYFIYWFTLQQLVHFSPPPLEEQTHAILDPYQPVDKKQNDALDKFMKDQKRK